MERVCHAVLRACKALLSEWKLAPKDYPAVSECVESVLNQALLNVSDPDCQESLPFWGALGGIHWSLASAPAFASITCR